MMSRAGLLSLIIFFLSISLAASAPLPELGSGLAERSYDYDDIFERSPAIFDRELETEEYIARDEFEDYDLQSRSFFSKLKNDFKKVGKGIEKAGKGLIKFDLKAMSAVSGAVGKVGKFIPGVSTAATTFSKAESRITGAAAKRIH